MKIWAQAKELAVATPAERNRYVDFLRAVSILTVVTGHWLIVALHYQDGSMSIGDLLEIKPKQPFGAEPVPGLEGGEYLYVRAVQIDGGAGWSSPFFFD